MAVGEAGPGEEDPSARDADSTPVHVAPAEGIDRSAPAADETLATAMMAGAAVQEALAEAAGRMVGQAGWPPETAARHQAGVREGSPRPRDYRREGILGGQPKTEG